MSTTATLGLTNLDPGQNQKEVTINGNMTLLDDFAAGLLAVTTKTATATLLKTEGVILSNHSAAATYTLPGTGAGVVPKIGQRFIVRDVSGNAGVNNITLAAPGGVNLDGVTAGSAVLVLPGAWIEVVYTSTGYWTLRSYGVIGSVDQFVNTQQLLLGNPVSVTNAIALPTSGNQTPGYIPFMFTHNASVDQVIFVFGPQLPSSDATTARIRTWFHEMASTGQVGPIMFSGAVEDIVGQGTGHTRVTNNDVIASPGSISWGIATKTTAARRVFKAHTWYFLGVHIEGTWSAGQCADQGRPTLGYQMKKLSAGAQAFPYTPGSNPTTGQQFSSDQLMRPMMGFRYRVVS